MEKIKLNKKINYSRTTSDLVCNAFNYPVTLVLKSVSSPCLFSAGDSSVSLSLRMANKEGAYLTGGNLRFMCPLVLLVM